MRLPLENDISKHFENHSNVFGPFLRNRYINNNATIIFKVHFFPNKQCQISILHKKKLSSIRCAKIMQVRLNYYYYFEKKKPPWKFGFVPWARFVDRFENNGFLYIPERPLVRLCNMKVIAMSDRRKEMWTIVLLRNAVLAIIRNLWIVLALILCCALRVM